MKLVRIGAPGHERPGLQLGDGRRVDVSSVVRDFTPETLDEEMLARLAALETASLPVFGADERYGSPIARPGKIICVGLNYAAHAAESGMAPPTEPVLFFKATTALTGPYDGIVIPRNSTATDWEVELAVVIGRRATYVPVEDAMDHVLGYCLHNDWSERDWQLKRGGQWVKGKSFDTFAPLGPWLATKDEINNVHSLRLWLSLNGRKLQDSSTSDLIFGIPQLVSYISQCMTLEPGDVISTGTPAGVGLGMKPPFYLKVGDVVELGVDGLGTQRQEARAAI